MFPVINTIEDLLPHIQDNKQIRVKADELTGHIVVCYMVQDEDTFAGTDINWARECRGITFHPDGRIAARCLTKFFNIGEHDSVQPQNLSWGLVDRIMEKRDGSMITPVVIAGTSEFRFKTKKTFSSKEALAAGEYLTTVPNGASWIADVLNVGLTPTFEFTSPKFPIVIKYEKDELTLLHIRENDTGRYLTEGEIKTLGSPFPLVANLKEQFHGLGLPANLVSWDLLRDAQENTTGLEGWVIQFRNGDMVKLKTKWYCDLHHAVTFTRWRDIARSVVADQADDLKGAFAMTGRSIEPILLVERKIKARIEAVSMEVRAIAEAGIKDGMDAKAMAFQWKTDENFGLIMRAFRNQEVDWMAWYAKTHLENDFGLEVVGDDA
jgi:T4 RnlA family RNA ligase